MQQTNSEPAKILKRMLLGLGFFSQLFVLSHGFFKADFKFYVLGIIFTF